MTLVALSIRSDNRGAFLDPQGIQYLNPVAARAFEAVAVAFEAHFGKPLIPVEAHRSWDRQNYLYTQWIHHVPGYNLATKPGSSTHETEHGDKAVDFGSGVATIASAEHAWMVTNGPRWGWIWTGGGFNPREGWHFEQNGTVVASNGSTPIPAESSNRPVGGPEVFYFSYAGPAAPKLIGSRIAVNPSNGDSRYLSAWESNALDNEVAAGRAVINPLQDAAWNDLGAHTKQLPTIPAK